MNQSTNQHEVLDWDGPRMISCEEYTKYVENASWYARYLAVKKELDYLHSEHDCQHHGCDDDD